MITVQDISTSIAKVVRGKHMTAMIKKISLIKPHIRRCFMAINSGPNQNGWQTITSIFSSTIRIPLALLTAFLVVCVSVIGFALVYRITTWIYVTFLARPFN